MFLRFKINEQSAIHLLTEDSDLYQTVKALVDSGFVDISDDTCREPSAASILRQNFVLVFFLFSSFTFSTD